MNAETARSLRSCLNMTRRSASFSFLAYANGYIEALRDTGSIPVLDARRLNDLAFNAHEYARKEPKS